MRPIGKHFALLILDNPKTSNIATIDHYSLSLVCCIFPETLISGRCDVIDTQFKVRWFLQHELHELTFCIKYFCKMLLFCSRGLKDSVHKKVDMTHETHVKTRKSLIIKC